MAFSFETPPTPNPGLPDVEPDAVRDEESSYKPLSEHVEQTPAQGSVVLHNLAAHETPTSRASEIDSLDKLGCDGPALVKSWEESAAVGVSFQENLSAAESLEALAPGAVRYLQREFGLEH